MATLDFSTTYLLCPSLMPSPHLVPKLPSTSFWHPSLLLGSFLSPLTTVRVIAFACIVRPTMASSIKKNFFILTND